MHRPEHMLISFNVHISSLVWGRSPRSNSQPCTCQEHTPSLSSTEALSIKALPCNLFQSVILASFSYLQWIYPYLPRAHQISASWKHFKTFPTTAGVEEAIPRMTCQLLRPCLSEGIDAAFYHQGHVLLNGLIWHPITRDTSIPSPALEASTFETVDNSKTFLKSPGSGSLVMGGHTML